MKESLEKLLIIREEITSNEEKIKFQDDEMVKTQNLIDYYKGYYDKQKCALEHFCNERKRLSEENTALIEALNSLNKDEMSNHIIRKHIINDCSTENPIIKKLKIEETTKCDSDKLLELNTVNDIMEIKNENNLELLKNIIVPLPLTETQRNCFEISINNITKKILKTRKKSKIKCAEPKKKVLKEKPPSADINVTLKVPSTPINKWFSVDKKYKIHKILIINDDSIICGNHGLLSNYNKTLPINYSGHDDFYIYNLYVFNKVIISIAYNYILAHNIAEADTYKLISSFDSPISCTYMHKNVLYGALQDGTMFLVDMCDQRVRICDRIFPTLPKSMAVVKQYDSIYLVIGMLSGDIRRYNLGEDQPHSQDIGKVDGVLRGIVNCVNIMVCYTDHRLYYIDRMTWKLSLIRETSNSINLVDVSSNNVIMVDSCNILHRYIIKKGKIRAGSTIESLPITGNISALHINEIEKKIVVSCQSEVYHMKL